MWYIPPYPPKIATKSFSINSDMFYALSNILKVYQSWTLIIFKMASKMAAEHFEWS